MTKLTIAKGINAGLRRGHGERPQGPPHGRGHRQARRRLPGHRRPAEGLRRGPGDRHPARRVRHRRHRDRPGAARLPPGGRDPVRRLRLPGLRPDRQPGRQDARPLRWARSRCRSSIRIPFGGGIGAVEHHSESPEAYFAHTAGLRVVACSNPRGRLLDDPAGDRRPTTRSIFFEPKRRYWEKGEVDPNAGAARRLHDAAVRARRAPTSPLAATARWCKTCLEAADGRRGGGPSARGRSTCARCPRSTSTPSPRRSRKTGRLVVVHEASTFLGMGAEIAARDHRAAASTSSRRRCCGSAATTCRTRRAGSRRSTCPTSTGSSTPSTARWRTERQDDADGTCRSSSSLPDPGEGLTEAEIVTWHVEVGDTVKVNDIVVEIETAKSLVELPVPFAGVVTELLVRRGRHGRRSARRSSRSTTGVGDGRRRCRRPRTGCRRGAGGDRRRRGGRGAGMIGGAAPERPGRRAGRLRPADDRGQAPPAQGRRPGRRAQAAAGGRGQRPRRPRPTAGDPQRRPPPRRPPDGAGGAPRAGQAAGAQAAPRTSASTSAA